MQIVFYSTPGANRTLRAIKRSNLYIYDANDGTTKETPTWANSLIASTEQVAKAAGCFQSVAVTLDAALYDILVYDGAAPLSGDIPLVAFPFESDVTNETTLYTIKAETALIVADTNELQTDDIPGKIATAQVDLDTITGTGGAFIATDVQDLSATLSVNAKKVNGNVPMTSDDVNTEVDTSLSDVNLDHLMKIPVSNRATITEVVDDTVLANLMTSTDGNTSDFDHSTDSFEAISAAVSAAADILEQPTAQSVVDGTVESGDYTSCNTDDGIRFAISNEHDNADTGIDVTLTFQLGYYRFARQVDINGYFNRSGGGGRIVEIYVYNWTLSAWDKLSAGTAETEMRDSVADKDYIFSLSKEHTKRVATIGEVQIRFLCTGDGDEDELFLDYVGVTGASSGAISPSAIADAVWRHTEGHDVSRHTTKYIGTIWYVDGTNGSDGSSGKTVHEAFATITAAITAASAGDRIKIFAGTYAEAVNINKAGLEIINEYGVIIDAAAANCVTVSADDCKVTGVFATPSDGYYGFVTSNVHRAYFDKCDSYGGGAGGFRVDSGSGRVKLMECSARGYDTTGFDLDGDSILCEDCVAMVSTGSTIGYRFKANASRGVLFDCRSIDNAGHSYQIDAGADNNMIFNCAQSKGCGALLDSGTDSSIRNLFTSDTGSEIIDAVVDVESKVDDVYDNTDTIISTTDRVEGSVNTVLVDTNELQTDDIPGKIAALNNFDPSSEEVILRAATETQIDNIEVDTNELQTDDIPGKIATVDAKIDALSSFGSGSVTVTQDYGGVDNLTYETGDGVGIDNAVVRAYLKTDYDAGNLSVGYIKGATTTDVNGRWEQPLQLDPATYIFYFFKQGKFGSDEKEIIIT